MMQKISGILPSNSRITTVDMTNSKSMRSSVPGMSGSRGLTEANQTLLAPAAVDVVRFSKEAEERVTRAKGDVELSRNLEKEFFQIREQQLAEVPTPEVPGQDRPRVSLVA